MARVGRERRGRGTAIKLLKRRGRPVLNRIIARYSMVGDPVVFDARLFPFTAILEASWETIRQEATAVLELREHIPAFQDVSPDQYRISTDAGWKTFWLQGFGRRSDTACSACPATARLLEVVPGLENAFFSILAPRKHVPAHRGVCKGLINCHLGLIVPRDRARCRIRVGEDILHWEEGRSAVFDDTNEHEVWNDTDQERVVLMVQFRRPLRSPGEQLSRLFLRVLRMTPYVTRAMENHAVWERRFADAVRARRTTAGQASGAGCPSD